MKNSIDLLYLVASILFILSLQGLASPKSARSGNFFGIIGMITAICATAMHNSIKDISWIVTACVIGGIIGTTIAFKIKMTAMPQLVAAFHSLVGISAVFIATAALLSPIDFSINIDIPTANLFEMGLGAAIGAITFSGSVIAFVKLQGIVSGNPTKFHGQHLLNLFIFIAIIICGFYFIATGKHLYFYILVILSLCIGVLIILPIGGADMPVVVSMLNSYSGWAASGIGFTLGNNLLVITGALVGASGAILSYIMCKAMNRSIWNVIFGGFGTTSNKSNINDDRIAKSGAAEDAAFLMQNAESVIVIPGYGMAVAQAQHALKEMTEILKTNGVKVRFAIHPVAGRMPGHMNVLLAEANVSYEDVFELDEINDDFITTDIAFVIGANDITNPAAKTDKDSPIFGMPILEVINAKHVLFVKRSMSPGYAGVQNEIFFHDKTMMLFGDAKKVTENIVKAFEK